MAHRHNKKTQMSERVAQVANLHLQGIRQQEIATQLGIARSTVSLHLARAREYWRQSTVRDIGLVQAEQIAKINEIYTQAWIGWQRSLRDEISTSVENERGGDEAETGDEKSKTKSGAGKSKTKRRRVGQSGNPAYLDRMGWCITKINEMLGIDRAPPVPPEASRLLAEIQAMDATIPPPAVSVIARLKPPGTNGTCGTNGANGHNGNGSGNGSLPHGDHQEGHSNGNGHA